MVLKTEYMDQFDAAKNGPLHEQVWCSEAMRRFHLDMLNYNQGHCSNFVSCGPLPVKIRWCDICVMDMRRDKRVHESEHALSSTTTIGQQSAPSIWTRSSSGTVWQHQARDHWFDSHWRNKKLKPSGTGVPGFTSTVLTDSDVPHFCQLKGCVEELCGHIRETVVWERNMGKELLDWWDVGMKNGPGKMSRNGRNEFPLIT